eukprot:m.280815 g.280815  ORF g.280815 m.280815 type:complete len:272 (-) comp19829_c5_seq4:76-891(-)
MSTSAVPRALRDVFLNHISGVDTDSVDVLAELFFEEHRTENFPTFHEVENSEDLAELILGLPDVADYVDDVDELAERLQEDINILRDKQGTKIKGTASPCTNISVGCAVLALLAEDGAWHEGQVVQVTRDENSSAVTTVVKIHEFGCERSIETANEIVVLDDLDDTSGDGGLEQGVCEMCRREMKVTGHHLIPKSEHSRFVKKGYKASFLKGSENIANICRACHNMVHRLASNKELADTYNTVEKIMECAFILRWVEYIATQTRALANKRS